MREYGIMEKIDKDGNIIKVLKGGKKKPETIEERLDAEVKIRTPKKAKTVADKMEEANELKGQRCRYCLKFKPYSDFRETTNPFVDRSGYMSICSLCLTRMLNDLSKTFENYTDAFYNWCQNVDVIYDSICVAGALDQYKNHNDTTKESLVTKYWRLLKQKYREKPIRYRDTRTDNMVEQALADSKTVSGNKRELREKWGEFKDDEYKFLEDKYEEYTSAFGVNGPNERDGYKTLAMLLLRQRSAPENKDITAAIKAQYEMLGIDPKQLRKENKDKGGRTLGLEIAMMEQTDPADYYDQPEMYFDHDGLEKDLKDLLRAQKNHLTGSRDFESFDISTEIIDQTSNDEPIGDVDG